MKKNLSFIIFFMHVYVSITASDTSPQIQKSAADMYTEKMKDDTYGTFDWKGFVMANPKAITANNVNTTGYKGYTALHCRAWLKPNFEPTVKDLVEMKGDVNARSRDGFTPLFNAVDSNNIHIVQDLILCKADPCIQNTQGKTARAWVESREAIQDQNRRDFITFITYAEEQIQAGKELPADKYVQFMACFSEGIEPYTWRWYFSQDPKILTLNNINATDNAGQTALHLRMAVPIEVQPPIKSLLKLKANINAQDKKGDTPLHKAAQCEKLDFGIIQTLVDIHADVSLKNKQGKSVADMLSKPTIEHAVMQMYVQQKIQEKQKPVQKITKEKSSAHKKNESKKDH